MYRQASIARNELLNWINEFLCTSYTKLEDASNGAVACQILDSIYPHVVPMKQLDFSASTPYECEKNYKVLRSVINKLKLPLDFNMASLKKQSTKESYEFLATMKAYFDDNYGGEDYDALNRRKESKEINRSDSALLSMSNTTTRRPSNTSHTDLYTPRRTNQQNQSNLITERVTTLLSPNKENSSPYIRHSQDYSRNSESLYSSEKSNSLLKTVEKLQEEKRMYEQQIQDYTEKIENIQNNYQVEIDRLKTLCSWRERWLANERLFYYQKLRNIEIKLQDIQKERPLTDIENEVLDILYSREGMQDMAFMTNEEENGEQGKEDQSVNSNDVASIGEQSEENCLYGQRY